MSGIIEWKRNSFHSFKNEGNETNEGVGFQEAVSQNDLNDLTLFF